MQKLWHVCKRTELVPCNCVTDSVTQTTDVINLGKRQKNKKIRCDLLIEKANNKEPINPKQVFLRRIEQVEQKQ